MARKSLDDILEGNDEPETEVEAVEAEAPEPEPQNEEMGEEPGQQEAEPEAGSPPAKGLSPEEIAAVKGERERRQRAEAERETFRSQLEALQKEIEANKPKEPEAPPPSIWEDENAWAQHMGGQLVSQSVQQAVYQSRLQMSEMLMAEQVKDFASVKDQLVEFVGSNPAVNQQVAESTHPWRTAYQAFKNHKTMSELGTTDLEALKAKMREELLAELQQAPPPKAPQTLSNKRSVASRTGPAWSGPKSLDELLG